MINHHTKLKTLDLCKNKILKKDFYKTRFVDCCPECNSKKYVKYGFYNGIQRYICKDCKRTFSKTTNSLWSYSKKDASTWIKFIELFVETKSLRFCAKKLGISLVTAFYWRHKILHSLTLDDINLKNLKGTIHIGIAPVKENFKGCRNLENNIEEMYLSDELDSTDKFVPKDTTRETIWIVAATGSDNHMAVKPAFKNNCTMRIFNEKVYPEIDKASYIVAYQNSYLKALARKYNKLQKLYTKAHIDKKDVDLRIRYFRPNLNSLLCRFHGVATKYLERYLRYFVLLNIDKISNCKNILLNYSVADNNFINTDRLRLVSNYIY
ncbi:IS1 family transposase [Clostridium sp. YIM B02505]|uniref:IS1 family transposase n=1 Tax=Clostridium yunnanense TaxID=2800325 RepID=A0ABS1EQA6_9CLOT|nr:IS1 family transposase [Clostridium yunnanense]MBK1811473.1 IS1 family transposase [Clostridium yunnanense]